MEYHQQVQQRTAQTVPVITKYQPTLKLAGKGAGDLLALSTALNGLAQGRDDALFAADEAVRAEFAAFLKIRLLGLKVPALIEAFLGDDDPLVDSLDAVFATVPRTTEAAVERAQVLRPIWVQVNAARAARSPAEPPIVRGGLGLAELDALVAGQPGLEQTVANRAQDVKGARQALRAAATGLDKLNKRFYKALAAFADADTALADALTGITTESSQDPDALSIAKVLQGGADQLHVLVSYDAATFDAALTNTLEWRVVGVDAEFAHTVAADASGNSLGPFAVGKTVQLRTRASKTSGTTTGSVRTILLVAPVM